VRAIRAVASWKTVRLLSLRVKTQAGSGTFRTIRVQIRPQPHQRATIWACFGILRVAFVKMTRQLKLYARASRLFGTSRMVLVEVVLQLECVGRDQTGVITSRVDAGLAWACLVGACVIVVLLLRINAISTKANTIPDIASVPAVVVVVARQFSSMFRADSI
jgi:hypothetical protein